MRLVSPQVYVEGLSVLLGLEQETLMGDIFVGSGHYLFGSET